jgi:hypothetical protein
MTGAFIKNKDGVRTKIVTVRQHLVLPDEVKYALDETHDILLFNAYLAVLKDAGWTLLSLANAINFSHRETVRLRILKVDEFDKQRIRDFPERYPVPALPMFVQETRVHEPVLLAPEKVKRLLELKPYAELVGSNSPRYREEAEEYVRLLAEAHFQDGVTLYRLAKQLGCTHGALRFRLVRYGYLKTKGKSKIFKPIIASHRPNLL